MMDPEDCSPRCRAFLADLQVLCARYQVYLTPSGYDMLQIWDVTRDAPEGFAWEAIEDCTEQKDGQL